MKIVEEGVVVFNSTHDSIKAEKVSMEKGFEATLVSTHPDIDKGCGFMLKIDWNKFTDLVGNLEEAGIDYRALYYLKKEGFKKKFDLLYEK